MRRTGGGGCGFVFVCVEIRVDEGVVMVDDKDDV